MKNSQKLTFAAIFASLSTAFMLIGYFPYFTYAVPAVAGLFVMAVFLETDTKYALGCYAVGAVLSLILCEKEAATLYLCLFGFYPILKAYIEKLKRHWLEWIIKIAVFNLCAGLSFYIASAIFGIGFDDLNSLFKYGIYVFFGICNVAFVLYDIAISRIAMLYMYRLHGKIRKIFKK